MLPECVIVSPPGAILGIIFVVGKGMMLPEDLGGMKYPQENGGPEALSRESFFKVGCFKMYFEAILRT